ncbi:MAG: hypothetical protein LiPW39_48 [Parcubacteria group bacterium LiPW_39]|nr:MAG: hypothetical protein LiPW39_48 [Parcubacteria group bacterium LiPW_39]
MELLPQKENLYWTEHARIKMRQYRLSESRVKRVLRFPKRLEIGVAPETVAAMQPAGSKKHPYEIWVMWVVGYLKSDVRFQRAKKITIISAWKYPGVSPVHEPPPIPEDAWEMVRKMKR